MSLENSLRCDGVAAPAARPFKLLGSLNRRRACPAGSDAIRALIWTPGTAVVIGVVTGGTASRLTRTARSVRGVNAPSGKPGNELSSGVVNGLFVVRSALSKQLMSTSSSPSFLRICSQRVSAKATAGANSAIAIRVRLKNMDFLQTGGRNEQVTARCLTRAGRAAAIGARRIYAIDETLQSLFRMRPIRRIHPLP